jgi:hypothetical protein
MLLQPFSDSLPLIGLTVTCHNRIEEDLTGYRTIERFGNIAFKCLFHANKILLVFVVGLADSQSHILELLGDLFDDTLLYNRLNLLGLYGIIVVFQSTNHLFDSTFILTSFFHIVDVGLERPRTRSNTDSSQNHINTCLRSIHPQHSFLTEGINPLLGDLDFMIFIVVLFLEVKDIVVFHEFFPFGQCINNLAIRLLTQYFKVVIDFRMVEVTLITRYEEKCQLRLWDLCIVIIEISCQLIRFVLVTTSTTFKPYFRDQFINFLAFAKSTDLKRCIIACSITHCTEAY